jgi:hypothetical protein
LVRIWAGDERERGRERKREERERRERGEREREREREREEQGMAVLGNASILRDDGRADGCCAAEQEARAAGVRAVGQVRTEG